MEIGADGLPFAPVLHRPALTAPRAARGARRRRRRTGGANSPGCCPSSARDRPRGPHDEEQGRARLFELTARLLERLAAERTVVLALEDLHWADPSTRAPARLPVPHPAHGRLLVVATYRSDDIHRRHPLRPLLAELDRLRTVRRVELARFNRDEVHRQIAGILAARARPGPRRRDLRPLRRQRLLRRGARLAASTRAAAPASRDSLRDLLLVRVEALPEERPAGRPDRRRGRLHRRVRAAARRRPARARTTSSRPCGPRVGAQHPAPTPDGDGYRFRHSLVREAVSDDLLPGERSRLNRRYAEALEADPPWSGPTSGPTRLASYWYHAHDAAKALPAVLDASVEARRRHAYAEQLRLLERAMELWDDAPDEVRAGAAARRLRRGRTRPCGCDPATTPLRYLDLMAEAAVAGRLCGERERALKITKRALRLARRGAPTRCAPPGSGSSAPG